MIAPVWTSRRRVQQPHRHDSASNDLWCQAGFHALRMTAGAAAQILSRAPLMEDFRMASSRVGAEGGIALAQGLSAGDLFISCCIASKCPP